MGEGQREGEGERKRERERLRISSRLHTVSTESDAGLKPIKPRDHDLSESESRTLN